jgi:predicted ATPase
MIRVASSRSANSRVLVIDELDLEDIGASMLRTV